MKISIVGTGYVGLVTGTCFAEMGVKVTCVDVDAQKIKNLEKGIIPIYEPGLDAMVKKNYKAGTLRFTTDLAKSLRGVDVVFSTVGTPPDENGHADLKYVLEVARSVGREMNRYLVFVTKSTVPVGTSDKVRQAIAAELCERGVKIPFDVVSNPEFLKEGSAIADFMSPDRIVVGASSDKARAIMSSLYRPMTSQNFRLIFMDLASAEMTKYAANAILATKISFMNEIANLCEHVGADVDMVRQGVTSDSRIGSSFMQSGTGYGGSCFPKDVKALIATGDERGVRMSVIAAVDEANDRQKSVLFEKLDRIEGDLQGKTIAIWGLSFKPDTDDMREAPSLVVIEKLLKAGARVKAFDPIAMEESRRRIGDKIEYAEDMYDAVIDADALLLVTEWTQFRMPSWSTVKRIMKGDLVLDGRNIYERAYLEKQGFRYEGIGR